MLLQVLISELMSNLANFSHSWKIFSFLTYAIPCHTHAEVDFEVISVPSIAKNVSIFRIFFENGHCKTC